MEYTAFDLQIEDIMWFGIDANGLIFACTTAGCANVPKFVCESREINEQICSFIMGDLKTTTTEILETSYEDNDLINDAIQLARKGVYCFDAVIDDENHSNEYVRIASPSVPLHFEDLPAHIQEIFTNHVVNVDITVTTYLRVSHAY